MTPPAALTTRYRWYALGRLALINLLNYVDRNVIGGIGYRYFVRAYDLAGNRSVESNLCPIRLPDASEAGA